MTEAQVATLARRGVVPERDLTWVQASLLIDHVTGAAHGRRATTWLHENGANAEEAARVIERAKRELREPRGGSQEHALDVRLEVLDGVARDGRRPSGGETREREALQRWQSDAIRDHMRRRRLEWARRAPATEDPSVAAARRWGSSRPPPRMAR